MSKSKINLKIVFFGTGELGLPVLEKLIDEDVKPLLLITAPDRPAGRGLKLKHSAVKDVSMENNIPVLQPDKVNDEKVLAEIKLADADIGLIIAYGQKISSQLIDIFPYGIINLHASLLPKYRGAAPVHHAVINGEKETGLTVMQINERIDAGKILNRRVTEIAPLETSGELHDRLAEMGPELVIDTLKQIQDGTVKPESQDPEMVTLAPKLKKSLSKIDWTLPAENVSNLIRGLWPWPGAHCLYMPVTGKVIKITFARAEVVDEPPQTTSEPGTILDDLTIATGEGKIKILELKPAGSKLMSWKDFVNGRHVAPGGKFTTDVPI